MLKIKKMSENAKEPEMAHEDDLGIDVFAAQPAIIHPGEQVVVSVGWAMEYEPITIGGTLFHVGFFAKQPSGVAKNRKLFPTAGVIDSNWRGCTSISLYNYGKEIQQILIGDKIAQLVPILTLGAVIKVVDELSDTSRGEHGWGSGHKDGK